jgi:lichenan operon transcriptional antiterminator
MNEKERIILEALIVHDDWLTSFSLSSILSVSVRSVKTYISNINTMYPGLIASSRKGFIAEDKTRLAELLESTQIHGLRQEGFNDRKKYIFQKLLLDKEQYSLDMIADELAISPITLLKELPLLNRELADYDLSLKSRNNTVHIAGSEANKIKMICHLIYHDARESFLSIKLIQGYLPHCDLIELRKIIVDTLRKHDSFIDDYSTMNLILHIAITIERHQLCKSHMEEPEIIKPITAHIRAIITDIINSLQERFKVDFTQREIQDFTLLILTRVIENPANKIQFNSLEEAVGTKIAMLVRKVQQKSEEMFSIKLSNPNFTLRFSIHIKNLLIRLENKIYLYNPHTSIIKKTYPFIYDVSLYVAGIISSETGYILNEDEIAYIAMYLGVLIEENAAIRNKIQAVLVADSTLFYRPIELAEKISRIFENDLLLLGVVSSEDEIETYPGSELIISTIPLNSFTGKPLVQIYEPLENKGIISLGNKIADLLRTKIKMKVDQKLKQFFRKEFFYTDQKFKDQNDALDTMAGDLIEQGLVDTNFKDKLFEREKVSSSAYSNIAMPHPLEMCAFSSVIGVSLHPHGICWNGSKVHIIFLLAINIRDRLFFKDIFDFITEVIVNEQNLKKILYVKTFDEFIDTLISFVK